MLVDENGFFKYNPIDKRPGVETIGKEAVRIGLPHLALGLQLVHSRIKEGLVKEEVAGVMFAELLRLGFVRQSNWVDGNHIFTKDDEKITFTRSEHSFQIGG